MKTAYVKIELCPFDYAPFGLQIDIRYYDEDGNTPFVGTESWLNQHGDLYTRPKQRVRLEARVKTWRRLGFVVSGGVARDERPRGSEYSGLDYVLQFDTVRSELRATILQYGRFPDRINLDDALCSGSLAPWKEVISDARRQTTRRLQAAGRRLRRERMGAKP